MMTFENFMASTNDPTPPAGLSPALAALWWMAKGEWARAHTLIDALAGANEAWVHAHLHRVEGDQANANYWYRRAGRSPSSASLESERSEITKALLRA